MAYWQRWLRRWQGSMESAHYITWNTKCCLYFLKLCKILCTFGQKLEGKREQRKQSEIMGGWSCLVVWFPLICCSNIILVGKPILMSYARTVCLVLCCHIFSASQVMVAGWAVCYLWTASGGLNIVCKVATCLWPGARPHPLSPNLQSQTRGLHFPPLLPGREWIMEHKGPIRAPRVGREFRVCSVLPLRSTWTVCLVHKAAFHSPPLIHNRGPQQSCWTVCLRSLP